MRNRSLLIVAALAAFAALCHVPKYASADAVCAVTATPPPAGPYGITIPKCGMIAPGPGPTSASGIPLVQPTGLPTPPYPVALPTSFQTSFPTPIAYTTASPLPVNLNPAQVNACNTTFTACSNVGTTVADGYSDLLESIFSTGFVYNFNGASWDRGRNAGIGNGVASTGISASAPYGEYLTALPSLTTGQYSALQLDSSGRLIISPTGLPTPLATQPVSGTVTASLPYGTASNQTGTSASGILGEFWDGTNVQPAKASTSGVLMTSPCGGSGTCASVNATINGADGNANSANSVYVSAYPQNYNGTTWDRERNVKAFGGTNTGLTAVGICDQSASHCASVTTGGSVAVTSPFTASTGLTQALACDQTKLINISTATTTSVVALSAGTAVYVCSYSLYIVSGTLPAFVIEAGTGAACVTTQAALTGTFGGIAGAVGQNFTYGSGTGTVLRTPTSDALCIVSSGTTPNIQGVVNYAQF